MKRNVARQHSRHRDRTPSVICLPPPKPPTMPKQARAEAPDAAVPLPRQPEPLVTDRAEARLQNSRQARRKARRDEAKARRRGQPLVSTAPVAQPAQPAMPAPAREIAEPAAASPSARAEAESPLPQSRSLAKRPTGIALVTHRLRALFVSRRAPARSADQARIARQLRALRSELSMLQQSVDRMIEGITA